MRHTLPPDLQVQNKSILNASGEFQENKSCSLSNHLGTHAGVGFSLPVSLSPDSSFLSLGAADKVRGFQVQLLEGDQAIALLQKVYNLDLSKVTQARECARPQEAPFVMSSAPQLK